MMVINDKFGDEVGTDFDFALWRTGGIPKLTNISVQTAVMHNHGSGAEGD